MRQLLPAAVAAWIAWFTFTDMLQAAEPIDIGSRRELFVDQFLVHR
jgi:hypothetical protein